MACKSCEERRKKKLKEAADKLKAALKGKGK
jgi:hypothetical protein